MNTRFLLLLTTLMVASSISAQYETVVYDVEKNYFSNGQPLPFETNIMLNGVAPLGVSYIEFNIYPAGKLDSDPLYGNSWKRTKTDQTTFDIPINFLLRPSNDYGFSMRYFYDIQKDEKLDLYKNVRKTLMAYIDQSILIHKNGVDYSKGHKKLYGSLNEIVDTGTEYYRNDLDEPFRGFSGLVHEKLDQMEDLDLKDKKYYLFKDKKDSTYDKSEQNYDFFMLKMMDLKKLIDSELVAYLNTVNYIMAEQKKIESYETDKGRFILPLNIGYGAIYNSGGVDDLSYGDSPYAGLSFPLGNGALKNNLLSNMNVAFGVYFKNFDDENGREVTGPIIDRPIFLGLGTRAFKLARINLGVTALQSAADNGDFDVNKIYLRPSLNLNLELGLWLGQLK